MKSRKHLILTLIVFVIIAALYRVLPPTFRQPGFAPHLAIALFAGAVIRDKKWAFAFPIASIVISDLLYQVLYLNGLSEMPGFYEGQFLNYLLLAGVTVVGFLIRKINVLNVMLHSVTIAVVYYLVSNFFVWNGGGGWGRPHTFEGLIMCYIDALPFLGWSILGTWVFAGILFGGYRLLEGRQVRLAS